MSVLTVRAPQEGGSSPSPAGDVRIRRLAVPFAGAALLAAAALVAAVAAAAFGVLALAAVAGLAVFTMAALRPSSAPYTYLATLPFLAGIDRGVLLPLVRPNEALLAILLAGAIVGGYLRFLSGIDVDDRCGRLDARLAVFGLLSTVWPVTWLLMRGLVPDLEQLAALLPVCKLIGLFVLVRLAIRTEVQMVRLARIITWPAAVLAVVAVLQTAGFPPIVAALGTLWTAAQDLDALTERGTTTFASSIATGDYIVLAAALLWALTVRGMVGRREQVVLALPLAAGTLAAGQFSTWASAAVVGAAMFSQHPEPIRMLLKLRPGLTVAAIVGLPALWTRLSEFGDGYGVPRSWLGRWDNLVNFYLPGLGDFRWVLGVGPDSVLQAPETWRDVIYLEYGYLQFLWVGGLPLLAAFVWLSLGVLRHARRVARRPDGVGAYASVLWAAWWMVLVLSVIDIHLVLRGTGEVVFTALAIVSGAVAGRSMAGPRTPSAGGVHG